MDPLSTLNIISLPPPVAQPKSNKIVEWTHLNPKTKDGVKIFPRYVPLLQLIWQFQLLNSPRTYFGPHYKEISRWYNITPSETADFVCNLSIDKLPESIERNNIKGSIVSKVGKFDRIPLIYLLSKCYETVYCYSPISDNKHNLFIVGIGRKEYCPIEIIRQYLNKEISFEKVLNKEFALYMNIVREQYIKQIGETGKEVNYRIYTVLNLKMPESGIVMESIS